jgi:hypothetical protein
MKKILIYKPSWRIKFHEKDTSQVFANPEPVNLAKILSKEYEVVIGSENDLPEKGNPRSIKNNENDFYKRILLNGKLYLKGDENISEYCCIMRDLRFIDENFKKKDLYFVTDVKIFDRCKFFTDNYDFKVVSQSKNLGEYGDLEKFFLLDNKIITNKNKLKKLVYCGNQRNNERTDLVGKYLLGNDIKTEIYGKWNNSEIVDNSNFKGPIPCEEVSNVLSEAKYSLIISDKEYRRLGFITPRYWECLLSSTIPFIDSSYDKDEILVKKNDFRIVHDYKEMMDKIIFLESNNYFYKQILEKQSEEIKPEYVSGEYQLKRLVNILER